MAKVLRNGQSRALGYLSPTSLGLIVDPYSGIPEMTRHANVWTASKGEVTMTWPCLLAALLRQLFNRTMLVMRFSAPC